MPHFVLLSNSSVLRTVLFTSVATLILFSAVMLSIPQCAYATDTVTALAPINVSQDTGEKPQSKIWTYGGSWWAVLPSTSVTPNGTWLWRLDTATNTWSNVLQLSANTTTRADAKVVSGVVHVLLHSSTPELVSLEYVSASNSYQLWTSRPTTTALSLSGSETATIDVDSAGRMWLATESGTSIEAYYSDSPYTQFNGPITLANNTDSDDISVVTALPNHTIGVLWSNQATRRFGFKVHIDGADPNTWSADEVPASQSALDGVGLGMADDHLNVAVGSDSTLYAAVKTSYDASGYPKIALLVRRPNSTGTGGTWDNLYAIDDVGTRGIVVLDENAGLVRVIYSSVEGGGDILYKESPISTISFGGARQTLMSGSSGALNNVTSTKQNWSDSLVVLASTSTQAKGVLINRTAPPALVGYWKLDEGTGTTLLDSSGRGNHATTSGSPTWAPGKIGLALATNGTNQYATAPNSTSLDITGPITLAAWVKPAKLGTQNIMKKATGTVAATGAFELSLSSAGKVFVRISDGTSLSRVDSATLYPTTGATWMHVAATYDGSTIKIYVNGVSEGTASAPASIKSQTTNLGIGAEPAGTPINLFQGQMDDLRIYKGALSAAEIAALAANAPPIVSAGNDQTIARTDAVSLVGSVSDDGAPNPPGVFTIIGWSKISGPGTVTFADASAASTSATFSTAGVYTLRLAATDSMYTSFDDVAVTVTSPAVHHLVLSPGNASIFVGGAQTYTAEGFDSSNNSLGDVTSATTFSIAPDGSCVGAACGAGLTGTHTVTGTSGTATGTATLTVNAISGIDNGLLAYWKMDEGSGSQLIDASGLSRNASITGSPQWVTGVSGQALSLSGAGQYATLTSASAPNPTTALTVSAWIRPGFSAATTSDILTKALSGGAASGYDLLTATSTSTWPQKISFRLNNTDTYRANSTTVYPLNNSAWMHVAGTYDGTSIRLYINGVLEGTVPGPQSIATNSTNLGIGGQSDGARLFNGSLDDVRLYNRALSADEIKLLAAHHLSLSPASANIPAGGSQAYTAEARDVADKSLGDVTSDTSFSIEPDGSCTENLCSAVAVGSHTVTGLSGIATGTSTLNVNAVVDHIEITPAAASITSGSTQAYKAEAFDASSNSLGDVTTSTVFTISPDGSCSSAVCGASLEGQHIVTATYSGMSANATLTVTRGPLNRITITPATATIAAGGTQTYTAEGFDSAGNTLGDVTATTIFSISPDGSCTGHVCGASVPGPHSVTGTSSGKSAIVVLTVTAGILDHVVIRPTTATITSQGTQSYTAEGFDQANNSLGDVTSATTFTIAPDGSCTGASCGATMAGAHTVSGTTSGKSATATLTVTAGALHHLVLTPATASVMQGVLQSYTAEGFDLAGNSRGDVTSTTTFTIAPNGTCIASACGAALAGTHTVSGTNGVASGAASLTVSAVSGIQGGLLAYWKMDEASGSQLVDSSGYSRDATIVGSPQWVTGVGGQAVSFSGTGQYATVASASAPDPTVAMTVSVWIRPAFTVPSTSDILTKTIFPSGPSGGYDLVTSANGYISFRLNNTDAYRVNSSALYPLSSSTWMHVAATYDGTTMRLYINGVLDKSGSGPTSIISNTTNLGIGGQSDGTRLFNGSLDDVRLYNRALDVAEIEQLATHHLVISPSSSTISPGDTQTYTADARNASDVSLGDVTALTAFTIAPDGSCTAAVCTATEIGVHTVTGTFDIVTGTSALIVATPVANQPPVVEAGSDQTITLPASASLNGSATDDGLPNNTLTFLWEQVSGPGVATFADGNSAITTVTFSAPGAYVLKLTASDGALPGSDQVTITVDTPSGNYGVDLNGSSYVRLGNPAKLHLQTFTLETWFKRTGTGTIVSTGNGGLTAVPLITKGRHENDGSAVDMNFFLGIDQNAKLAADFEDMASGANHPITGTTTITDNVWHHAAATFDGSMWHLYLDGKSEGAFTTGGQIPRYDSIQHAAIGTTFDSSATETPEGYFAGVLDEVRVWNRALPASEIIANINSELSSGNGLVARWGMNDGYGTTAVDSLASPDNGTLASGASWVSGAPFDLIVPHAPNAPVLVAPSDGSTGTPTDVPLEVTASDPDGGNVNVTFFGRAVSGTPGADFTIAVLPDSQYYTASMNGGTPAMLNAQTQWIANNSTNNNIVYVVHEGDVTNDGDTNATEWINADAAFSTLEVAGIPYGLALGNHDQSGGTALYNQYFGESRFTGRPYYGGHYGSTNNNHYDLFTASGQDFIVVYLEYGASSNTAVMSWANQLLQTYSNRRAIVVNHDLISAATTPVPFSSEGQAIYSALNANPNLFLMLCGHAPGEGQRTDPTSGGGNVYSLLADYQSRANGGSGWMRLLRFSPTGNTIHVETYSPWLSQTETDGDSQFDLSYTMSANTSFATIGSATIVSGTNATFTWPALQGHTPYEWYATVSDGSLSSTGPTWSFSTLDNAPVINVPASQTIAEQSPLTFKVSASDADGDSVTLSASNLPVGADFNSTTGAFTWTPGLSDSGTYTVTFTAGSGTPSLTSSGDVTITVTNNDRPPVLTVPSAQIIAEGAALTFTVSGTDPDGESVALTADQLPAGATFTGATGTFSWTPNYTQAGTYTVVFIASSGTPTVSDSKSVDITVTNTDRPPVITVPWAQTVAEGGSLTFSVSASDPDNDPVSLSATNLPSGATFNGNTGDFTWAPGFTQAGTYTVTFTAAAGTPALTASNTVTITVTNTDRPPVLTVPGPQTASTGSTLTFSVSGADPDGTRVTLSASNMPTGATFKASTGTFSWKPSSSQTGAFTVYFTAASAGLSDQKSVAITVGAVSSTTLTSSLNPSTVGQQVTFTARVASSSSPVPTGMVTFADGATTLGTATLSAGIATFPTSTLAAGAHSITASYAGDTTHLPSISPALTQTVNTNTVYPTTTALSSAPNPSLVGQTVLFTAIVTSIAPSSPGAPSGTVTFRDGSTALASIPLSAGQASYSTTSLPGGTHSITAVYSGDASFEASTSPTVKQRVTRK